MNAATVRLFHVAVYTWLALYMGALIFLGQAAWTNAPVDLFAAHDGLRGAFQTAINSLSPMTCIALTVLVMAFSIMLIRQHRWWLALITWFLFRIITHRAWLASNGGIQLMENMLLWSALMTTPRTSDLVPTFSFWAARLQLLLVYFATAAHKFTGTMWLDGSAVMRVALDPTFHLHWLSAFPHLCAILTFATLAFMSLFPFAVWAPAPKRSGVGAWKTTRRAFLLIGAAFHMSTAVFMDIPQMGFAFIACYAIWLSEDEAGWFLAWPARMRARFA